MISPLYPGDAVLLAPLSGYTDVAFRRVARSQGCAFAFTPLVSARAVLALNSRTQTILERDEDEPWLGVQVEGACPGVLAQAANILNRHRFDALDFNMGCPVPKVTRRGAGAALSLALDKARTCVEALVRASRFPVTAKVRVVSGTDPEPTVRLALALEEAGIAALTVHGREWEQFYAGPVASAVIREAAEALRIPVVANGGVFHHESARALRAATGCSRVMVARGAIGNPWIFRNLAAGGAPEEPSAEELCEHMHRHVAGMVELYGEPRGMRNARKIVLAYLKGRGFRRCHRDAVSGLVTLRGMEELTAALLREGRSPQYDPADRTWPFAFTGDSTGPRAEGCCAGVCNGGQA